ncbi:winged helix-turn-helix domain-containing protein [Nocardiopsis sp. NPDC049922]|uniref:ArsR/SmtB family transcription factor n=1 Tax=Nocardiopsis sp. NPDC049922 TaxID=3155157 RepID=UPI0033D6A55C
MTAPDDGAHLAALAHLLADPTRARICLALLDGRAWTATELARHTHVSAPTISEHLTRLVEGALLTQERQGRHRYVRLADPHTAHLVEALAAHSRPTDPPPPTTLRAHRATHALARARTCYDHLAGRLGVAITDALTHQGLLRQDTGFALTDTGLAWFTDQGITLRRTTRRPLARSCLDWTERRPHLAGVAGAALCRHTLTNRWCEPVGTTRALRLTPRGERALGDLLDIDPRTLR